jgi:hypothetical protein
MQRSLSEFPDDGRVNEVLDVFLQAIANKVLELAHRPGGADSRSIGLGTARRQLAHPNIATVIALKPKRVGD